MSGFYTASVVCDHRGWDGTPCDAATQCADGDRPPAMKDVRQVAATTGWARGYGPGSHGYDLCPEHAGQVPRVTFPDWRNPAADHVADQAAALTKAVDAFTAEMRAQGVHMGYGSPPVCVVCDVPYPCAAAGPAPAPACLGDAT